MKRIALGLVLLALVAPAGAAGAEVALKLPPPQLGSLLPLAAPPLDKPPVPLPVVPLPPSPQPLPELPAPRFVSDLSQRPVAPLPPPRVLACNPIGSVFGVASELLECGRARYQRGELEQARQVLEQAVQGSSDRAVLREARYWLGETLLRLKRVGDAERVLLLVHQDAPRSDFGLYAGHELGWVSLELNDPGRALGYFDGLLKGSMPVDLIPYARLGRGMALYGLKRYPETRDELAALLGQGVPRQVAREGSFWLGDTLGRLGDYKGAVARLGAFTAGGPQLLIESGLLRLGWWNGAAGQPIEAAKAYRTLLSAYPQSPEAVWGRAGLVQALLELDDYAAAREEAKRLEATDRNGALALPVRIGMSRWAAGKGRADVASEINDDLLARNLQPATRAYVLLLSAETSRQAGQGSEARDRFELVRNAPGFPGFGQYAVLRLAQMDFETREFAQAKEAAQRLLGESLTPELRAAALILAGEAAYWSGDYEQATALYGRFRSDFPKHPHAPAVGLALGWAELRRGRADAARARWTQFAREAPDDPRVAGALLLSAELAARGGDQPGAQRLLEQVLAKYPKSEFADVAGLNRAILDLRAGHTSEALPALDGLVQRGAVSPYLGRMRLARGIALLASGKPAEAQRDFQAALAQGEDAVAHLGLGNVAFGRQQWDEAAREYGEARAAGTGPATAAAEYGLAAVSFNQGKPEEFKKFSAGLTARPADPALAAPILYALEVVAADEKRWTDARALALRLVDQHPKHEATAAALSSLARAASRSEEWPLAREMYAKLAERFPDVMGPEARLDYAEALLRTGAAAEARRELEGSGAALPGDAQARATLLAAEAQESTGDRAAALDAYARIARERPNSKESVGAVLGEGRLRQADGKWNEARPLLEQALQSGDARVVGEAAYRLGQGLRATAKHQDAVEMYMTAAYVSPDSVWARRALLEAGQSFAALKQTDAAVIVYKKLLAMAKVEPELADAARKGLKALGIN